MCAAWSLLLFTQQQWEVKASLWTVGKRCPGLGAPRCVWGESAGPPLHKARVPSSCCRLSGEGEVSSFPLSLDGFCRLLLKTSSSVTAVREQEAGCSCCCCHRLVCPAMTQQKQMVVAAPAGNVLLWMCWSGARRFSGECAVSAGWFWWHLERWRAETCCGAGSKERTADIFIL